MRSPDAVRTAKRIGAAALKRLFETVRQQERIEFVTVVVNTHTPPERISSPHMRAHGKEGWLFREICEQAAETCGIEPLTCRSKRCRSTDATRSEPSLPWAKRSDARGVPTGNSPPRRRGRDCAET